MSKVFTYFKKTGEYRRPVDYGYGIEYEWDGDEGFEFEYQPEEESLKKEVVDILFNRYFTKKDINSFSENQIICIKNALKDFTDENNNWEQLYDDFEDKLEDAFRDEALRNCY